MIYIYTFDEGPGEKPRLLRELDDADDPEAALDAAARAMGRERSLVERQTGRLMGWASEISGLEGQEAVPFLMATTSEPDRSGWRASIGADKVIDTVRRVEQAGGAWVAEGDLVGLDEADAEGFNMTVDGRTRRVTRDMLVVGEPMAKGGSLWFRVFDEDWALRAHQVLPQPASFNAQSE